MEKYTRFSDFNHRDSDHVFRVLLQADEYKGKMYFKTRGTNVGASAIQEMAEILRDIAGLKKVFLHNLEENQKHYILNECGDVKYVQLFNSNGGAVTLGLDMFEDSIVGIEIVENEAIPFGELE